MRPIKQQVGPFAAANATAVAASQTVVAPNPVLLNGANASGGLVTLDQPRQIVIASAGNDSVNTFTIVGTNWSGRPISETLAGGNAASVTSKLDYATISRITPSASTAAAVTIGTTNSAGGPWVRIDDYGTATTIMQHVVTGSINATVQTTLDDPNSTTIPVAPAAMVWSPHSDPNMQGFTTNQTGTLTMTFFTRLMTNAGTGFIVSEYLQPGAPSV